MLNSKTTIAVPPGATIKEQLEYRGMSQKEFATRMHLTEKHVSNLINGKVALTQDMAKKLEFVLGIPASFWNQLEARYQEKLNKVKMELAMESDKEVAKNIPYAKLAKLGWIEKTKDVNQKIYNLRRFFEVAELGLLCDLQIPGIVYRVKNQNTQIDYALAAWSNKARLEARTQTVSSINIQKLENKLEDIRALTVLPANEFCSQLVDILSDCGISIVFLPHIEGSFLHGATFTDGKKIVIGLTVRGKYADNFWFSLFHELGHIINGHIYNTGVATSDQELEVDNFAQEVLISSEKYHEFINMNCFSEKSIIEFSKSININPAILLGRLQKDEFVNYGYFNNLKTKYEIQ